MSKIQQRLLTAVSATFLLAVFAYIQFEAWRAVIGV